MSEWMSLETPSGRIRGWLATPHVPPRGALVVVQEIFGVNAHIRSVCTTFAEHGYVAATFLTGYGTKKLFDAYREAWSKTHGGDAPAASLS